MGFINEQTKKRIEDIAESVSKYAVLVDDKNQTPFEGNSFEPGVGLHTAAEMFRELSYDLRNGMFKTLVMGKFKNGKSTFVNALVGRELMKAKSTACTAVIATVAYGEDNDEVEVFYEGSEKPKRMSLQRFTDDYILTEADQDVIANGGKCNRFADVSYAIVHSSNSLFADGLQLIDSPGLEEDNARTKTTQMFVPKANAIIFSLTATSLFSSKEKEYIAENFAGKYMRNVFFIVNRVNQLNEGELENSVIPSVRLNLNDVFTDRNGQFDEELFKQRVFYINAYGAECLRLGKPYTIMAGKRAVEVPIEMEETGILEFEAALREFLNSEERIHATVSSTLTNMANTYQMAEKQVQMEKSVRSQSKEERERNAELAQKKLQQARQQVEDIRNTIETVAANVSQKIFIDLTGFVQNDIPREFEAVAKSKEARAQFGMMGVVKLAMSNIPLLRKLTPDQERIIKPLLDKVNAYTKSQLEIWAKRIPTLIDTDIKDLGKQLDMQLDDFAVSLDEAVNLFSTGRAQSPFTDQKGGGFKAAVQTLLAASNWDVSTMVEVNAGRGMNWMDFVKRAAVQLALDMAVTVIFGAPYLMIALIIEAISTAKRSQVVAEKLLSEIGNKCFASLLDGIKKDEVAFKSEIIRQFADSGERLSENALNLVKDSENNMARIMQENANDLASAEAENNRLDQNLAVMHELIDSIYASLFGKLPSEEEFKNLAKTEKKEPVTV